MKIMINYGGLVLVPIQRSLADSDANSDANSEASPAHVASDARSAIAL